MTLKSRVVISFSLLVCLASCRKENETRFIKLSADHSGIRFNNTLDESPEVNILSYEYTYNGGGVAAADFNNDGLCDLYFTGNTVDNRLYINQGELRFKDITTTAKVEGRKLWKTGVTAADVNGDEWLDLYVCYSGPELNQSFSNQLFINNGVDAKGELTFTERAEEYGLDASGTFSTQASFFDYDRDGDLDMFLINHGNHFYSPFINTNQLRNTRHPQFGNRLYRNDENNFTEVSTQAGIHGGGINFGLGVSISDLNNDGWPDIYVTNDYEEQDFFYLNNQDGTFKDVTKESFGHFSRNGMGTDIADFNNDSRPDLIEVDMWPEDNYRQKLLKGPDDFNRYSLMVDSGFHYQQMRNTLQMNAGVGPDGFPLFCEIGQLAGVSATDWSWAPLFVDLDNDGFKDLFITNGYLRDFTSMDFLKYTVEEARKKAQQDGAELKVYELVRKMPSTKTSDYIFRNIGDLTFADSTRQWGLDIPNLSFGATYADLDNDGDLELITNNTNEIASIWVNQNEKSTANNYLKIKLKGPASNSFGIGAKIYVTTNQSIQMIEQYLTRGYQSSVDPVLNFGLGNEETAKQVQVIWPDGKQSTITNVRAGQQVDIIYSTAKNADSFSKSPLNKLFNDVTKESNINFTHRENRFIDFDHEPLIPYQMSRLGPALAIGDVNGDVNDDFYIGGAAGQSGELYFGTGQGHFTLALQQPWKDDSDKEDSGATFFDADGDNDLDLFVVSGGNEHPVGSASLDDRLYLNQGNGNFIKAPSGSIVDDHVSGTCVVAADYDKDGDIDLYVGGGAVPGKFPQISPGAILKNESDKTKGTIKFTLATNEVNPALRQPGIVTDALWTDFNNDSWPDLLIVGQWMTVRLFENQKGKLVEIRNSVLENTSGLWTKISSADLDGDGDTDYVLGNAGINLPWKISETTPLTLYFSDFNGDQKIDPVISYINGANEYPVASRDELLHQMSNLRKTFTSYDQYGKATIEDVIGKTDGVPKNKIQNVHTSILFNEGDGKFNLSPLPIMAQISCVNGILTEDFNHDGITDILLAGNFYPYRTEYGPSDSSVGLLLLGTANGEFEPQAWDQTGFLASGDVRRMSFINATNKRKFVLLGRNNDMMSLFELTDQTKRL